MLKKHVLMCTFAIVVLFGGAASLSAANFAAWLLGIAGAALYIHFDSRPKRSVVREDNRDSVG